MELVTSSASGTPSASCGLSTKDLQNMVKEKLEEYAKKEDVDDSEGKNKNPYHPKNLKRE